MDWREKLNSFLDGEYEFRPEKLAVGTYYRNLEEKKIEEQKRKLLTKCRYKINGKWEWALICMFTGEIFIDKKVVKRGKGLKC